MRDSKDGTYDKKELPRVDFPKWTCHGKKTVHIILIIGFIADFIDGILLITILLFSYCWFY